VAEDATRVPERHDGDRSGSSHDSAPLDRLILERPDGMELEEPNEQRVPKTANTGPQRVPLTPTEEQQPLLKKLGALS